MAMDAQASARRRQMIGVVIGLLVAGASGVGLYFLVSNNTSNKAPQGTQNVVVALAPIAPGTKLDATNIQNKAVPSDSIPVGANGASASFSDVSQLTGSDNYAAVPINTNEVVTPSLLIPTVALKVAPFKLSPGDVAMAIPVDDQKGVGGWIGEGDHIDIIADVSGNNSVRFTLQDIKILRIGSTSQQAAPPAAGSTAAAAAPAQVTLLVVELTRLEAEEMNFMLNVKGTGPAILRYVLRPKDQYGKDALHPVLIPTTPPNEPPCIPNATPAQEDKCLPQTPTETGVSTTTWTTLFPG
jgi:Flp pilus assembly protein CpaB